MNKYIKSISISLIIILFTLICFVFSKETTLSFNNTIKYIYHIILPSLFPYMIFINLILYSNSIDYLSIIFKPLGKIFNISGYGITCIIASLLGGYPYNAILISSFLKKDKISKQEADRLLSTMFFPSFSFLFATLYKIDSKFILIIISLYISSFFLLFITSKKEKSKDIKVHIKHQTFINTYYDVMNKSISAIISISFCVIFFNLISSYINIFIKNEMLNVLIHGILEFSYSSIYILNMEHKTFIHYLILNNIICFSSFSIILQSYYYLTNSFYSIKKLLLSRITICIISSIIFTLIYFI